MKIKSEILINASTEFKKGQPKNYLSDNAVKRIATTYHQFENEQTFARTVVKEDLIKNDFNLAPSLLVASKEGSTKRSIGVIAEELRGIQEMSVVSYRELEEILARLI